MNAQGVDISVWQDNNSTPQMFDPRKARRKGASFVGIKVSQANWADPDYAANWANCRRLLYRMPYHFMTWDISPRRQAEIFWSLIEKDTWGLLPLICDFEWWKVTPSNAMDILYSFMERLKALASPLPLGIYTAKSFWVPNGSKSDYWDQFHLWLCDITGPVEVPLPWDCWAFHQYTFKLKGPEWGAESLDLDGDVFNGSLEQMIAKFNLPALDAIDADPVVITPEPEPVSGLYMKAQKFVNIRALPMSNSTDLGDIQPGQRVGPIRGIAGGRTGAWAHLSDGRYVCVADALGTTYLVEE